MSQTTLPPRWRVVRLGEVGEISGGGTPSTKVPEYWGGEIPWLVPSEVTKCNDLFISRTERTITESGLANCVAKLFPAGTVIMTSRATIGEVIINTVPMATNQGFINIVCHDGIVLNEYLAYWIKHNKHVFEDRAHGVTFKEITKSNFKTIPILLPPLPEQRVIAQVLRSVQKAKEARRWEAALERERKAALMQHLLSHGTHGEPRKATELGEMPETWRVVRFAQVVDIAKGQVNPTQKPYRTMIHIGPEHIEPGTGRLLATKTNEELKIISGNYLFSTDDVLYSKIRPYLNKVALPTFEGTCSADMYPLRPHKSYLTREFLFHFLLSEQFRTRAVSFQDRTGIPKINREQLGSIPLRVPPLPEQQVIAEILNACDAKIAALEREAAVLDELFRAMLEELMTGRLSATPLIEVGATA